MRIWQPLLLTGLIAHRIVEARDTKRSQQGLRSFVRLEDTRKEYMDANLLTFGAVILGLVVAAAFVYRKGQ